MQLKELYSLGKDNLSRSAIETPGLEAYLLLSESDVIDDLSEIYAHPEREVAQDTAIKFQELLERRVNREPIAYIIGEKEFYSKTYLVNPGVLIPRPETELLVDETLELTRQIEGSLFILEIGTGSGCIAVTLASYCDRAKIVASDISQRALDIAKVNLTKHGQNDRITLTKADMLSTFKNNCFDIIVSNPPYITESEFRLLDPEVKKYEPKLALTGGENGLFYINKIISDSKRILKNGGWCVLEIGYDQREEVENIFIDCGFTDISSTKDLNGIERVIKAKWKK